MIMIQASQMECLNKPQLQDYLDYLTSVIDEEEAVTLVASGNSRKFSVERLDYTAVEWIEKAELVGIVFDNHVTSFVLLNLLRADIDEATGLWPWLNEILQTQVFSATERLKSIWELLPPTWHQRVFLERVR